MKKSLGRVVVLLAVLFMVSSQVVIAGSDSTGKQSDTYVCDCGKDCKCGTAAQNAGKCVCGKEMKKTGAYACNCGKECKCGTVANQAGKCVCGNEMKKAR